MCVRPLLLLAVSALLAGCAATREAKVIKPGDLMQVHYTCRLKDGRIVDTTSEDKARDEKQEKSRLFKPSRQGYQPILMQAGGLVAGAPEDDRQKGFKDHIAVLLAERVVGLSTGKATSLELKGDLMSSLKDEDRYLQLARIWRYPKGETVAKKQYEETLGKAPEIGHEIPWRPPFTARVVDVTEHFVKLKISVPPDTDMETPFGTGKIRDAGVRWEVDIDAREGTLVRSGSLLGRIVEVGEKTFKVDFGYPFGNEPLLCEVMAEPASKHQVGKLAQTSSQKGGRKAKHKRSGDAPSDTPDRKEAPKRSAMLKEEAAVELTGKGTVGSQTGKSEPLKVETGDLVEVDYEATLDDGTLVQTTRREAFDDPAAKKHAWSRQPQVFGPIEIIAGERTVFPGLGDAVAGMTRGEKKEVPLVPDMAFGPKDPKRIVKFDSIKRFPKIGFVNAKEYTQRFGTFPVKGKEVQFTPYFKSRVIEVTENHVKLKALARHGERVKNDFGGYTETRIEGDEVLLQLIPEIGAPFEMEGKRGVIKAYDDKTFTVDYNHPLAGEPVVLEVEVLSVIKASELKAVKLPWLEDHDQGVERARLEGKPAFLLLYAAWCSWSKKIMNESLEDPRLKMMKDQFVWVKVNSDEHKDIHELYEQKGFPLVVVLNPKGEVIKKIDGYRDGGALARELKGMLGEQVAQKK
ncbi:MAG: FKBP-type peptidyl-prolyl cis-trans isomerase [Deltaproteobacteria bacterium]|nr:FKBP-type peptidyl-prolyl cis-trans isomerase [Deltaproteobacteria bacterium]